MYSPLYKYESFPLCVNSLAISVLCNTHITNNGDYAGVSAIITFPAGVTKQIVNVSTIDDVVLENPEFFSAVLGNVSPSDVAVISQPTATVNITNNDGNSSLIY